MNKSPRQRKRKSTDNLLICLNRMIDIYQPSQTTNELLLLSIDHYRIKSPTTWNPCHLIV